MIPSEEVSMKKKKNPAIEIYNFFPFTLANAKIELFSNLHELLQIKVSTVFERCKDVF